MEQTELHAFRTKHGLSVMQAKFVLAFTGNATQAARVAGYANPSVAGYKLLRLDKIIRALDALTVSQSDMQGDRKLLTRNDLMLIWSELASDPEATWKHRLKAMDSLAKSQGIFIDRSQIISNVRIESLDKLSDQELYAQLDVLLGEMKDAGVRLSIPHNPVDVDDVDGGPAIEYPETI